MNIFIYTYMYRDLEELQDLMWGEEEEEDFTHMPLLKKISAALIKKGFYSRPVVFFSKELTENGGKNAKEKLEQFRKWASDLRATVTQNEVGEIDVYVCIYICPYICLYVYTCICVHACI